MREMETCNGRGLAAGVTTKVELMFRGEDCTSLLERAELKGWEAGIMLAFPKGPNCITEFRDSYIQGSGDWWCSSGAWVVRWACSRTCWVLTPTESATPGLGVVVDIIWKMIQKCAGTTRYNLENDLEMCWHHQQVNPTLGYIRTNPL